MGKYCRLTREERYQLEVLLRRGLSMREIARDLGRQPSTISREVRKGLNQNSYSADLADQLAKRRRHAWHLSARKIQGKLESTVRMKIEQDWSPEQIAGRLHLEAGHRVLSHQTIYRYLEREKKAGRSLHFHLRILRYQRKDRKVSDWKKSSLEALRYRRLIDERPAVVSERNRLGDYERDTLLGTHNGSLFLTLVDRTSRLLKLHWLPDKLCDIIHAATVYRLKDEPVETITNDNGLEFARHQKTEVELGAKVYFSHPYHSWERGSNENTNGLIRQYYPKKTDIGRPTPASIRNVELLLNTRPRKCLGYQTPLEVHERLKRQLLR